MPFGENDPVVTSGTGFGADDPVVSDKPRSWLQRQLDEQKRKQGLSFGKRLLEEAGNAPLGPTAPISAIVKAIMASDKPMKSFGLDAAKKLTPLSLLNLGEDDGKPGILDSLVSINAPTPARIVKGAVIDPVLGLTQLGSRATGVGNDKIQRGVDSVSKFYKENFDESAAGEAAGATLTMGAGPVANLTSKASKILGRVSPYLEKGFSVAQGGGMAAGLTPEADVKDDADYWGRKWTEVLTGIGLAGGGLAAEAVAKYGKPTAQKIAQFLMEITPKQKEIAKGRVAAENLVNTGQGTNVKLSVGQLTDNPKILRKEVMAERLPWGMEKHQEGLNAELLDAYRKWNSSLSDEAHATPYDFVKLLSEAAGAGDQNASRILNGMERAGGYAGKPGGMDKVIGSSREANLFPVEQTNDALWTGFRQEGDRLGPISMEGEAERLGPLVNRLEQRLGTNSEVLPLARSVERDISGAQADLFPAPNIVFETSTGRTLPNRPGGLYEGSQPNQVMGSVNEFLSGAGVAGESIPGSPGGRYNFAGNNNPASTSTALNAGNIQDSVSVLEKAAAEARAKGDNRLAHDLEQVLKGMHDRLEQAVSRDPSARAMFDAANAYHSQAVLPMQNPDIAVTLGPQRGLSLGQTEIPTANALESKGKAAAAALIANDALMNPTSGGLSRGNLNRDVISPAKTASILERTPTEGYFQGQRSDELEAFLKLLRSGERSGQLLENPATGNRSTGIHLIELLKNSLGASAGALSMGTLGPLARKLFASPAGRELFLSNPDFKRAIATDPALRRQLELAGLNLSREQGR